MPIKYKFQLFFLPLIILPAIITWQIFTGNTEKTMLDLQLKIMSLQVNEVLTKSKVEQDILVRAGLHNSDFFTRKAKHKIINSLAENQISGVYFHIFSSNGDVIYHPSLYTGNFSSNKAVKELITKRNGTALIEDNFSQPLPRKKYVVFRYFPEWDWIISAEAEKASIYSAIHSATQQSLVTLLVLLAISGLLMLLTARSIARPLEILKKSVLKFGEGDLSARARINTKDEVGVLAKAFNTMGENIAATNIRLNNLLKDHQTKNELLTDARSKLAELNTGLERKVKERTEDLKNINTRLEMEIKEKEKAIIQADRANKSKSLFLANMSHEIRTPLNSILGFAELLNVKLKEDRLKKFSSYIQNSGNSLLSLLNDILDLSKVESGKLKLQPTTVELVNVFEDVSSIFSQQCKEKNLKLTLDTTNLNVKTVVIDPNRLRQILLNIVGNAVKFTEKGGITITLNSSQGSDKTKVNIQFSVEDTGIGIAASSQKNIFESFEQQEQQDHGKYGGTGLGLAITKKLIELMRGKITLESILGHGSVFHVYLFDIPKAETGEMDFSEDSELLSSLAPSTIVIADDILLDQQLISKILEYSPVKLLFANDSEKVIELTQKNLPSLLLVDAELPQPDVMEITKILKASSVTEKIPIVAVTSKAFKEMNTSIKNLCDDHISKPITKDSLYLLLTKYLDKKAGA